MPTSILESYRRGKVRLAMLVAILGIVILDAIWVHTPSGGVENLNGFGGSEILCLSMIAYLALFMRPRSWPVLCIFSIACIAWPLAFWAAATSERCGDMLGYISAQYAIILGATAAIEQPLELVGIFLALSALGLAADMIGRRMSRPLPLWSIWIAVLPLPLIFIVSRLFWNAHGIHPRADGCSF